MKKKKIISLGILCSALFGIVAFGAVKSVPAHAEEEPEETEVLPECTVVLDEVENGTITADIMEGDAGTICTLTIEAKEKGYIVDKILLNGAVLKEFEFSNSLKKVEYQFVLTAGENKITATFIYSEIASQLEDKGFDLNDIFSLKNIIVLLALILNGGLLIGMVRYYIKDKKLADKVENAIKESINKIIPDLTRQIVLENFEKILTPMMSETNSRMIDMQEALSKFAKCLALSQQNTPEAKTAIINELASLKIGDAQTIADVKAYIERIVAEQMKAYQDTMKAIEEIKNMNKEVLAQEPKIEEPVVEEPIDNGTQI